MSNSTKVLFTNKDLVAQKQLKIYSSGVSFREFKGHVESLKLPQDSDTRVLMERMKKFFNTKQAEAQILRALQNPWYYVPFKAFVSSEGALTDPTSFLLTSWPEATQSTRVVARKVYEKLKENARSLNSGDVEHKIVSLQRSPDFGSCCVHHKTIDNLLSSDEILSDGALQDFPRVDIKLTRKSTNTTDIIFVSV